MCVHMPWHICRDQRKFEGAGSLLPCPQKPEECFGFSRVGVTGGCDLPNMGAGKRMLLLCKSDKSS